jgi:hypothetical protein
MVFGWPRFLPYIISNIVLEWLRASSDPARTKTTRYYVKERLVTRVNLLPGVLLSFLLSQNVPLLFRLPLFRPSRQTAKFDLHTILR